MCRPTAVKATSIVAAVGALAFIGVAPAAPVPSAAAAPKAAAEAPAIAVRCWTGWQWSAAGFVGALRPGVLAVGSYYNSMAYGYSGAPQYYGEGYPPYYSCDPVYYADPPADGYVRVRHRHRAVRTYNR
jgi:hypothetical protein